MSPQDRMDPDGIRDDGVPYQTATASLPIYAEARRQLAAFEEPVLLHAGNSHERLFVAAFDGTGNDMVNDPQHITNVGLIVKQLQTSNDFNVGYGYVPGPGTQQHHPLSRLLDGMDGYTVDARAENMYKQFIDQANEWRQQDPHAQIRVAGVGFSRGAEEVALFARIVEERGIQDPDGALYTYDWHHQITHVDYTKPALVAPHEVAQAVALFDPVGTGRALDEDRRLPPSVISGIQLIALDEHRYVFKSDRVIDPGLTADGRFAGVYVPGAHSDVGGGYHRDGLSARSDNLVIDYLNGLSDRPFLDKRAEPDDPRLNVIHNSRDGMLIYRLMPGIDRLSPDGYGTLEASRRELGHVADPYNAEPRNEALNARFPRQAMPDGPLPDTASRQRAAPASELDQWIERMHAAALNPDDAAWDHAQHEAAQAYLHTPDGQRFQQQANDLNRNWDLQQQAMLHAQQQELAAQQAMQQQASPAQGRGM